MKMLHSPRKQMTLRSTKMHNSKPNAEMSEYKWIARLSV